MAAVRGLADDAIELFHLRRPTDDAADLIFSRSVRFSVFNFRWPDTCSSSSLNSSMLKGLVT